MQAFKSRFNTTGEDKKFLHRVLPTHAVTAVLKVRIALAGENQITAFRKSNRLSYHIIKSPVDEFKMAEAADNRYSSLSSK